MPKIKAVYLDTGTTNDISTSRIHHYEVGAVLGIGSQDKTLEIELDKSTFPDIVMIKVVKELHNGKVKKATEYYPWERLIKIVLDEQP